MPAAQVDVADILDYDLEEAVRRVVRQMFLEFVEAFRFLSRTPGAGHVREDLAEGRPTLFWPMSDYLILYKPRTSPLESLSIFRGGRHLPSLIGKRKLWPAFRPCRRSN
jgi:plasmid stabilization system protein ParE